MSGRQSAAVEQAVLQFGLEIRARRANKIRTSRNDRIALAKEAATLAGVHYTTLARALGLYPKRTPNGKSRPAKRG